MKILSLSVKRILEFVVKTHTFEGYNYPNETDLKAHAQIDCQIGSECIVLLDNRGEYLWMAAGSSADVRCTTTQKITKIRKQKVHNAKRPQVFISVHLIMKNKVFMTKKNDKYDWF